MLSRVLITGGGGMLASALAAVLAERGAGEVWRVDRAALDIADESAVRAVVDRYRPTVVFNCAAYTKVDLAEQQTEQAERINGVAVGHLARACREFDAALVHYSTDYVFDGSLRRPLRPDDPVGPAGAYGRSKLLGEQALQADPPRRWIILRTAWLYGPGGPNFVKAIVNAARAGKPLRVVADQVGSPTYTYDLAGASLDLLATPAEGIFHYADSGETNWHAFAQEIVSVWNLGKTVEPITSADWKAIKPDSAPRPAYSLLDTSPYTALTGKTPPPWQASLLRYHAAFDA